MHDILHRLVLVHVNCKVICDCDIQNMPRHPKGKQPKTQGKVKAEPLKRSGELAQCGSRQSVHQLA